MRLQQGEQIIHELRPESSIVFPWVFSKCLPAAFTAVALTLFFVPFFGLMLTSTGSEPRFLNMMGITGVIVAPTALILSLIYIPYLRKTHVYYITNKRCVFTGGIFTPGSTGIRGWPFWAEQAEIEFVGLKDSENPAATVNSILATFKATGE